MIWGEGFRVEALLGHTYLRSHTSSPLKSQAMRLGVGLRTQRLLCVKQCKLLRADATSAGVDSREPGTLPSNWTAHSVAFLKRFARSAAAKDASRTGITKGNAAHIAWVPLSCSGVLLKPGCLLTSSVLDASAWPPKTKVRGKFLHM